MATSHKLSVVVPTYNAIGQVEPLLNQLLALGGAGIPAREANGGQECPPHPQVIVADDASPDGTAASLAQRYPTIHVVTNAVNRGFGANAMNGVEAATGEYLALVNSDVELADDPFAPLVALLEREASIFAAMPLIYNTHLEMVENLARLYCHRGLCWHTELPEEKQWTAAVREEGGRASLRADTAATEGRPPAPIDAVLCGALFVCRRAQFLELAGFDPRYKPFYWEDVALGYAAKRRGLRCVTVPSALVLHRHSESIDKKAGGRKLQYLRLNQLRFVVQYRDLLHAEGLSHEQLWWLARSMRSFAQGDIELGIHYKLAGLGLKP